MAGFQQKTIEDFPVEILTAIFVLSTNHNLALASKRLHSSLAGAPTSVKVDWLLQRYHNDPVQAFHRGVYWRFFDMQVLAGLDQQYCRQQRWIVSEIKHTTSAQSSRASAGQSTSTDLNNSCIPYTSISIPSYIFALESANPEHYALIEELLVRGASPNTPLGYPIIKSAILGRLDIIKLLLKYGADPSARKNMALRVSAGRNNFEVVKLLFEHGVSADNETLRICVQKNLWEMANLLIKHGAAPDMLTLNQLQ
ncbi:hypothetical protein BC936DRAFT_145953 [Jimgerdemannia flammicorona]|uniref:Uncharacterized protein n=1 Tax=Jimgerdemannia flammicorona TaxID=994334 RepID=A0A433DLQ2_9FUNG|nr:hypothetical protein BC936DRAFT_145953 [Jimgerdemannia flammicorona]